MPAEVVVRGSAAGFAQEITVGSHRFLSDEPVENGGNNAGPAPYELLAAALGACTSMTLGLYARRKQWALSSVNVRLRHVAAPESIHVEIELIGDLTGEQRAKLLEIAGKCPVHRSLTQGLAIHTGLLQPAGA
jgi:putative redox protein